MMVSKTGLKWLGVKGHIAENFLLIVLRISKVDRPIATAPVSLKFAQKGNLTAQSFSEQNQSTSLINNSFKKQGSFPRFVPLMSQTSSQNILIDHGI